MRRLHESAAGLRAGLLCLLLMSPFTAQAALEATAFQAREGEIKRLYEDLDYEEALARIRQLRGEPLSSRQQVVLQLYEGILLCEMSGMQQGGAVFDSALRVWPTALLPVKVPPKVQALFESTRQKVTQERADSAPLDQPTRPELTPRLDPVKPAALTPPVEQKAGPALTRRWYFWAGVGVVAAAVTVGALVLASPKAPPLDVVCDGPCDGVLVLGRTGAPAPGALYRW